MMFEARTVFPLAAMILVAACGADSGDTVHDGAAKDGGSDACAEVASSSSLVAIEVNAAPTLNGADDDDVWKCVPWLEVPVAANATYVPEGSPKAPAYPGLVHTTVTVKAVYTDTDIYFVATWKDPEESLARFPWTKQADGTWAQTKNKDSSGHENTFYEDKFAIQWNISSPEFATQGCLGGCHAGADKAKPTKKYNNSGLTDMWHWKSVRTEPNGQLDDKHVGFLASGDCKGENCRLGDSKDGGGYRDNHFGKFAEACAGDPKGDLTLPCFMGPVGAERMTNDTTWILDDQKQPFVDTFEVGDQIAGMITSPFVGSRGDVITSAKYANGQWTLEMKRSLTTRAGAEEDVQFSDLSQSYDFGVAVFDNTQINHAMHTTVLSLTFRK